jgi:hypothetical protein
VQDRKEYFDKISRLIAITRYDIEQHQSINDLSLNIHGENFFRDIFNFIYEAYYENGNYDKANSAYIDLIDNTKKSIIQITSTRDKEKIIHSLNIFKDHKYKDYAFHIFYLLDKANPNEQTCKEIFDAYGINIKSCLKDFKNDLIKDIENLDEIRLQGLYQKYFSKISEKYTDEIVLNLVINNLLNDAKTHKKNYDDDLGSLEATEKIKFNNLNRRTETEILKGLDYSIYLDNNLEENKKIELRELVINNHYKNILIEQLRSKEISDILNSSNIDALHVLIKCHNISYDKIIHNLQNKISSQITVKDFNSMDISWIIVAYFFEICDVGQKQ